MTSIEKYLGNTPGMMDNAAQFVNRTRRIIPGIIRVDVGTRTRVLYKAYFVDIAPQTWNTKIIPEPGASALDLDRGQLVFRIKQTPL